MKVVPQRADSNVSGGEQTDRTEPVLLRIQYGDAGFELALRIRRQVFVDELGGPPGEEPDERDADARHVVLRVGGGVVGTGRLLTPSPGVGQLSRIAVLPAWRGRGLGRRLVRELLGMAAEAGLHRVILHAHAPAFRLYASEGFIATGDVFQEAGLPHVRMERDLSTGAEHG